MVICDNKAAVERKNPLCLLVFLRLFSCHQSTFLPSKDYFLFRNASLLVENLGELFESMTINHELSVLYFVLFPCTFPERIFKVQKAVPGEPALVSLSNCSV